MKGTGLYLTKRGYDEVIFSFLYLVLSPGLLYVDTVVLGLLLCLYIHTCNVL